MYDHIETMARAVGEGVARVDGAEVTIKRVPETMPTEAFTAAGDKTEQDADVASPDELSGETALSQETALSGETALSAAFEQASILAGFEHPAQR